MAKSTIDVKILGDNKGLSKALGEAEKSVGRFAKAAGAAFVGAGVAIGAGLFKIGQTFDEQYDKIRVGTGATGEALEDLQDSFKNVLKDVPASFDDAGTAIADLNTRLGLTGKPLEDLSAQMLNLSRITGTDVSTNVDKITRVFGDWEIATEDQAAAMDSLYRASQASGIGLQDLSGSVVSFGAPLRNLGFGFDESLALLAQFNKTGVNTETVFAGLKAGVGKLAKAGEDVPETFNRIVAEITELGPGSEATALAIELFGQRAGPDLADAIAGGKFALDDMLAAITDGSDTINDAAKDTESFGEKWTRIKNRVLVALEPVATRVFEAVGDAMDYLGPKIEALQEWLAENMPKAIEALKKAWDRYGKPTMRVLQQAFEAVVEWVRSNWPTFQEIFETVVDAISKAVEVLRDVFEAVFPKIRDAVAWVFDWITEHKDEVKGALVALGVALTAILVPAFVAWAASAAAAAAATIVALAPVIAVAAAVAALGAALVWAYQNVDGFRQAVDTVATFFTDTVWPILKDTAQVIFDVVSAIVGYIVDNWDTIQTTITTVFEAVKAVVEFVWDNILSKIVEVVSAIVEFIVDNWDTIEEVITEVFERIAGFVETIWDGMRDYIEGVIEVIQGIIKTVTALIKGDWDEVWEGIKQILSGVWDAMKALVETAIGVIDETIDLAIDGIKAGWELTWQAISDFFSDLWDDITGFVEDGIDAIVDFVTGLPGRVADGVVGAFDAIWDSFKGVINQIIDAWNGLSLPGFSLGGWEVGKGPFKFTVPTLEIPSWDPFPHIPRLHTGGLVPGPPGTEVPAILEAGERVIPADAAGAPIVLIIEGRPFSAMIAEHEQAQVAALMAGAR